jgi:Asp-tRNA(Asn)/Glu-tRNA(Gln) amidotransferase A subunit family amidase
MNMSQEAVNLSARALGQAVTRGDISAIEAVEAAIVRIEAVNSKLNAVVVKRYDEARKEARALDVRRARGEALGPLAGVAVTVKECLDVAGTPSTFGLPSRAGLQSSADELHVGRLRQSGAIVVGKTNLAQMLAYIESDNPVYGRTRNPWNLERSCGGSSGGEGALIGSGASRLGLGTDIGGSARYPAAFCAAASLKPTAGRCPDPGRYSFNAGQQAITSQVGVLAQHVDDVALGLECINSGPPLGRAAEVNLRELRVGYYEQDGIFASSPAVRRAVREAATALAQAGARVTPWQPHDISRAFRLFYRILGGDGYRWFRQNLKGHPVHPSLKPMLALGGRPQFMLRALGAMMGALGQGHLSRFLPIIAGMDVHDYWGLVEELREYREQFALAMDNADGGPLDLVLGPVCALPAFRHGSTKDLGLAGANTLLYNVLGYPAGVVPWTRVRDAEESDRAPSADIVEKAAKLCEDGSAGLPVAVQIAARPWREHVALAAMSRIEAAARTRSDYPARPGY